MEARSKVTKADKEDFRRLIEKEYTPVLKRRLYNPNVKKRRVVTIITDRMRYRVGDHAYISNEHGRAITRNPELAGERAIITGRYHTNNEGWINHQARVRILDGPREGRRVSVMIG